MNNLDFLKNLEIMQVGPYILKLFFIGMCVYYTFLKVLNVKQFFTTKLIFITLTIFISAIICSFVKLKSNSITSIFCLVFLLSCTYSLVTNNKFGSSILVTILSLSINYIVFFVSILIDFIPNLFYTIKNDYINLCIIIIIHSIILYLFFNIKKFKHGFSFLSNKLKDEYFDILILNISITILFSAILLNSLDTLFISSISIIFLILASIMVITIQKTLTMYYKHKLLVTELEDTKKELEDKNKEISELEKENLNFSKVSHSIKHKQEALEYKLNKLSLNSEIASELDIRDKLKEISNKYSNITSPIKLPKTEVDSIDNMLEHKQSECIKNNIDFELKLSGNVHHMINNFIDEENLEILLADLIKNAIIAINNSDNINRSILVKLGMIDKNYSVVVYDSGIEFKIDTLMNLGLKPSSTHLDDGGTGMGFLNTFDTLNKTNASIYIDEIGNPSKDNYTKSIYIIFDNKNEYRISSYRSNEIKENNIRDNLLIE